MIVHKEYKELVENLFKNDENIENRYYEESEIGPDIFHVVFKEEVNGEGYVGWMTWHLIDTYNITKETVRVSIWIDVDTFLDNVFKLAK
jgi:hypothetical protein